MVNLYFFASAVFLFTGYETWEECYAAKVHIESRTYFSEFTAECIAVPAKANEPKQQETTNGRTTNRRRPTPQAESPAHS